MSFENISMGYCKKDITPLLTHWSYVFFAQTHGYTLYPSSNGTLDYVGSCLGLHCASRCSDTHVLGHKQGKCPKKIVHVFCFGYGWFWIYVSYNIFHYKYLSLCPIRFHAALQAFQLLTIYKLIFWLCLFKVNHYMSNCESMVNILTGAHSTTLRETLG